MKPRPLLLVGLFFVAGLFLARILPERVHPAWLLVPAACISGVFLWKKAMPWLLAASVLAGLFYAVCMQEKERPALDALAGRPVTVKAWVAGQNVVEIRSVLANGQWREVKEKAVLRGKGGQGFAYGDLLLLKGAELEKPTPPRNPGGFDAEGYDRTRGIFYELTVPEKGAVREGRDDRGLEGRVFGPVRDRLLQVIRQEFAPEHQGVAAGLLLGITSEIDPDVMSAFQLTGVVHILAVSGANVALLVVPLVGLLKACRVGQRKRYGTAIVFVLLYAGLAEGGPPVVRACTMTIVWCLGRLLGRESDTLTSWMLAGWGTLLYEPAQLDDLGFKLTFLITLGLLLIPPHLQRFFSWLPDRLAAPLVMTVTAELISVPLVLRINPAFTPLSLAANLYLVPLLALLVPCVLLTVLLGLIHPGLAWLPSLVSRLLLDCMIHPLTFLGATGWWVRNIRTPATWWLWGYYAWWFFFSARVSVVRKMRKWAMAGLALVLAGGWLVSAYAPKDLRVTYLDVGQGDSILIEMPKGQVWLVDGGGIPGFEHSDFDVGKKVVVPALAAEGVNAIDVLVMTHADEDHVRGLLAVLERFEVKHVVVSDLTTDKPFYRDLLALVKQKGIPLTLAEAGQVWTPEADIAVTFWNPPARKYTGTRSDTNANAVVFSLRYGQKNFLFTADLEGDIEPKLRLNQHIDVLKVSHHGSNYSSTLPFLKQITPTAAVLSVGEHNHYGHPGPDTLKRLQTVGAQVWRTDQQGAIRCETDGEKLTIYSWLQRE